MERHGHLRVSADIRHKLVKVSAAQWIDFFNLSCVRQKAALATLRLKNQNQVRTFVDWNNVTLDFFEIDLVAHCVGDTNGTF